jgi:hypothetical protein
MKSTKMPKFDHGKFMFWCSKAMTWPLNLDKFSFGMAALSALLMPIKIIPAIPLIPVIWYCALCEIKDDGEKK